MPKSDDDGDPKTTPELVRWFKANLAAIAFLCGVATATGGGLIGFGAWTNNYSNEKTKQHEINEKHDKALDEQHHTNVDVDRRLNEATAARNEDRRNGERADTDINTARAEARRQLENEISDLRGRVLVLEAQMQIVGGRVQQTAGRR